MSRKLYSILQNQAMVEFAQNDYDDLMLHYDYHLRVARARWLKDKFGKTLIPKDLFQAVVSADLMPEVLDSWFDYGGLNCVYYRCKQLFGGGDDVDSQGVRELQDEIAKRRERQSRYGGQASPIDRTVEVGIPLDFL